MCSTLWIISDSSLMETIMERALAIRDKSRLHKIIAFTLLCALSISIFAGCAGKGELDDDALYEQV